MKSNGCTLVARMSPAARAYRSDRARVHLWGHAQIAHAARSRACGCYKDGSRMPRDERGAFASTARCDSAADSRERSGPHFRTRSEQCGLHIAVVVVRAAAAEPAQEAGAVAAEGVRESRHHVDVGLVQEAHEVVDVDASPHEA